MVKLTLLTLPLIGLYGGLAIAKDNALSASDLDVALIGAGVAYHAVGENVRLVGRNGQGAAAAISSYKSIVDNGGALPPPGGAQFSKATQYALCNAESSAVLQILETLTLFKTNVNKFSPSQISKIQKLLKRDRAQDAEFSPSFAKYVPACSDAVDANNKATQASYSAAIKIYSS